LPQHHRLDDIQQDWHQALIAVNVGNEVPSHLFIGPADAMVEVDLSSIFLF
jgi:hypothetical protein